MGDSGKSHLLLLIATYDTANTVGDSTPCFATPMKVSGSDYSTDQDASYWMGRMESKGEAGLQV